MTIDDSQTIKNTTIQYNNFINFWTVVYISSLSLHPFT